MTAFLGALERLPDGYWVGRYEGRRWGVTVERLAGGRQVKLYGEALGGAGHASFNLYLPSSGKVLLKPCEMPAERVVAFVEGVKAGNHDSSQCRRRKPRPI